MIQCFYVNVHVQAFNYHQYKCTSIIIVPQVMRYYLQTTIWPPVFYIASSNLNGKSLTEVVKTGKTWIYK